MNAVVSIMRSSGLDLLAMAALDVLVFLERPMDRRLEAITLNLTLSVSI